MNLREIYNKRDLLTGAAIYSAGDSIAAILFSEFSFTRMLGISLVGAFVYGLEIPHYFRWVETATALYTRYIRIALRTILAILYFNPLWVARHLFFISAFSSNTISLAIVPLAFESFIAAIPLTVLANITIQNCISLRHRFAGSAIFSFLMAVFYPLATSFLE